MDGIEPGEYIVSIKAENPTYSVGPGSVAPGASRPITLTNKGCAEVLFYEDPFASNKESH